MKSIILSLHQFLQHDPCHLEIGLGQCVQKILNLHFKCEVSIFIFDFFTREEWEGWKVSQVVTLVINFTKVMKNHNNFHQLQV